jgi:predicted type IV restriction endonuclease
MPAPAKLIDLIDRFERNLDAYRAGQYNETQVRREFIDPFLKLLGWDVDNEKGYAEAYKEVVHEDAIRVGRSTKAPDYSLRIGGQRKLFVEAKKPSVNLKDEIAPAFQVRRYAWSAKLPLSILTDFEEFAVYDFRPKPNKNDPASHSRVM